MGLTKRLRKDTTDTSIMVRNDTSNEVSMRYHEIGVLTPKNSVNFSYSLNVHNLYVKF